MISETHANKTSMERIREEILVGLSAPLSDSGLLSRIHSDLNYLTPSTLAKWLEKKVSTNLIIIDCRYPYEFNGGHIQGAINLHTEEMILQTLMDEQKSTPAPVVVFHCEFSSCRGPARYRYLRNQDRKANMSRYPHLFYPHVFLLEGGYNTFYSLFPALCIGGYTQMADKKYKQQLRDHKSIGKPKADRRMERYYVNDPL